MDIIFSEKKEKIILFLVFVLAIFLITFHFTDTPKVWVDEGVFTETAKNLAMHGTLGIQTAQGEFFSMRNFLLSTSYPVIFPVALSLKLFGAGLWQARLPMIIYMFILVVLFYFFVRKKYGFHPAILSVLMLLSFSPFYGNGRPVQGEVPGLVFLVFGALLLLYLEESSFRDNYHSKKWAILSGLAFGLSASTKPIFLVILPISLLITLFFWIKKVENRKILWFFVLGFILPVILWAFIHVSTVDLFLIFISKSFHLASNIDSPATPLIKTIFTNFLRFFTESTPILFSFLFCTVVTALSFRFFKKINETFSIAEYLILSFIILNLLTYLAGTGWYRYFFPAHTLLYLFFPASILVLSQVFKKKVLKNMLFVIPIALILFQFYHLIFLSDTSFTIKRTRNYELAKTLSEINPSQKVLFYGVVETVIFLKGDNYSQYFSMGDFFEAGNKNISNSSDFDFILIDSLKNANFQLYCYNTNPLGRYFFLQKIKGCH